MSDTPPALNEIGDDADAAIGDERAKSTSTGAPLNDDLFFSTISDPEVSTHATHNSDSGIETT